MTGAFRSIDAQLRFAIENRRLVEVRYHAKTRIAEPHDYGVHKGIERVLVYQLTSEAGVPQRNVGWRLLDVPKIEHCAVLDRTFPGSRGQSHRNHLAWEPLYVRVR